MIGVGVSMLTAVLVTRAMLALLANFSFFNRPSFMGVSSAQMAGAGDGDDVEAPEKGRDRGRRPQVATPGAAVAGAADGGVPASAPKRPSTAKKRKRR